MASPWTNLVREAEAVAERLQTLTEAQQKAVEYVVVSLQGVHGTLRTMATQIGALPEAEQAAWVPVVRVLAQRYDALAGPIARHADEVGVAPLLVVGGLALSVVAIAWALVAYEYVVDLQAQTALAAAELKARVDALRAGKNLPGSTLNPPGSGPSGKTIAFAALGLGLVGAGIFAFRRAA